MKHHLIKSPYILIATWSLTAATLVVFGISAAVEGYDADMHLRSAVWTPFQMAAAAMSLTFFVISVTATVQRFKDVPFHPYCRAIARCLPWVLCLIVIFSLLALPVALLFIIISAIYLANRQ